MAQCTVSTPVRSLATARFTIPETDVVGDVVTVRLAGFATDSVCSRCPLASIGAR
jgi:hypothetical protein